MIRCREKQSRVLYPSELDDEMFLPAGISNVLSSLEMQRDSSVFKPTVTDTSSWLHGWNFTTDLYRILEHAIDVHRGRPQNTVPFSPSDLFHQSAPPQSEVLDKIMRMHENLPSRLKETRGVVGKLTADRYSFQAANIAATLQVSFHSSYLAQFLIEQAGTYGPIHSRRRYSRPEMRHRSRTPR
jgi:hypothetical protein